MAIKKAVNQKTAKIRKSTLAKPANKPAAKTAAKTKKLVMAVGSHCFWTKDGQILKDLKDLETAFKKMPADVYSHHVTKDKNDFASWVESILKDQACASDLRKAKKPTTAKTAVTRHLKSYVK